MSPRSTLADVGCRHSSFLGKVLLESIHVDSAASYGSAWESHLPGFRSPLTSNNRYSILSMAIVTVWLARKARPVIEAPASVALFLLLAVGFAADLCSRRVLQIELPEFIICAPGGARRRDESRASPEECCTPESPDRVGTSQPGISANVAELEMTVPGLSATLSISGYASLSE